MLQNYYKVLATVPIAGAMAGWVGDEVSLGQIPDGLKHLAVQCAFAYGSGGTTAKAYVQTSLDGGATWIDIMSFAFTTTAAKKISAVSADVAASAAITPTDGTLTDNTIVNGILGDRVRVKVTTTGTYAGATSLTLTAVPR